MSDDWLNAFPETLEVASLLGDMVAPELARTEPAAALVAPSWVSDDGIAGSQRMDEVWLTVNWRNRRERDESESVEQVSLPDPEDVGRWRLGAFFEVVNWTNQALTNNADEYNEEAEQPFLVENMFSEFQW